MPTWAPAGVSVALAGMSLTAAVDDCAYACLQGGYSILSSVASAAVQLLPVAAMPYPSCTCPILSAPSMSAAGTISGTFSGAQGSYSFTASVEAANRVTLSLMTAAGAALGAATYDAAGCVPSTIAFCGVAAAGGSAGGGGGGLPGASATPSPGAAAGSGGGGSAGVPGASGISGGAVAGIVIGLLLAAAAVVGAVSLVKKRAGAGRPSNGKRSSAASQARVKQLEATNVANPMRTSNSGGGGGAKASFAAQPRGAAV